MMGWTILQEYIRIAGTVFANQFRSNIAFYAPGLDPQITEAVRTTLTVLAQLPPDIAKQVVVAYVKSLSVLSFPSA